MNEEKLREYLRKVTVELHDTKQQLRDAETGASEPIAIVGMACRFPGGVRTPGQLWELVDQGRDAIGPFPADRGWDMDALFHPDPDHPRTTYVDKGAFLDRVDQFDPELFSISPREALAMDPQQRQLLEVSWELFERAGIASSALRGTDTGVFIGTNGSDYASRLSSATDGLEGHLITGSSLSVLSGRVSYTFGLTGPSLSIDTACSSSLVALHLACGSLRRRETSLAIAGGVTIMSNPGIFVAFSRQRALSPDARCRAFSDEANGTGWGEGVGTILLERLSDAERNGRNILAVVRGSAVNQDGASNGLTAPNGPAQQRVIRQALANAHLAAEQVDVVEAHGTGTVLGDPIEAQALLATYGQSRSSDRPLWLGSVKSNIGHTQAAAGVAGVIKMVEAMRHRVLPPTLHAATPSRHVDWGSGNVRLLHDSIEWPRSEQPTRAAVSSFGVSGTNAHVILEGPISTGSENDVEMPAAVEVGPPLPWLLSARTPTALAVVAKQLLPIADDSVNPIDDIAWTLASGRAGLNQRAVVVANDREQLGNGIRSIANGGEPPAGVVMGSVMDGKTAFVFPGQGSQWVGMGLELIEQSSVFRASMLACDEALRPHTGFALLEVLHDADRLQRVDVVQPALWSIMVSLADLWRSVGVEPSAVVGHSQGEIAAAVVAGALSLEDGAKVVALRSAALLQLEGSGGMLSTSLAASEAKQRISQWGEQLSVAAENSPFATVISGDKEALAALQVELEQEGVRVREIPVTYASHSAPVEQIGGVLLEVLAGITPVRGKVPIYSTVTGEVLSGLELDEHYWYENLRRTVQFRSAIRQLADDGYCRLIECSPHPVLTFGIAETVEESARAVGTLRRDEGSTVRFWQSLAEAWVTGAEVDWPNVSSRQGRLLELPTYPFEESRFWLTAGPEQGDPSGLGLDATGHPLLGAAISLAGDEGVLFTGQVDLDTSPWLADHRVGGEIVLTASVFLELGLRAASYVGCQVVEELVLELPLVIPATEPVTIQAVVGVEDADGSRSLAIYSRHESESGPWTQHASGTLCLEATASLEPVSIPAPEDGVEIDIDAIYDALASSDVNYGPAFQVTERILKVENEAYVDAVLGEDQESLASQYLLHPALVDAALQAVAPLVATASETTNPRRPFIWRGVRVYQPGKSAATARVSLIGEDSVQIALIDLSGEPIADISGLVLRESSVVAPAPIYQVVWGKAESVNSTVDELSYALTQDELSTELASAIGIEDHSIVELDSLECPAEVDSKPVDVIVLPALFEPDADVIASVQETLVSVQSWLEYEREGTNRLLIVTRHAVSTTANEKVNPAAAAVIGLLKSAQSELPERIVLLDIDEQSKSGFALDEVMASGEPQIAIRKGVLLVPRLDRTALSHKEVSCFDDVRTVVLTGATGIARLITRHLVTNYGVRHFLLLSRRGINAPGAAEFAAELTELGARIRIESCDVTEHDAVSSALESIDCNHPVSAVLHAAAVLDDSLVASATTEQVLAVLKPKVRGIQALEAAIDRLPSAPTIVAFSSTATTFGGAGQGSYAAANAYLDAWATNRSAAGLPAVSMAWGLWEEKSGMAGRIAETDLARMYRGGLTALSEAEGLALFDSAIMADEPAVIPAKFDMPALNSVSDPELIPPIFRSLASTYRRPSRRNSRGALAARVAGLSEQEQHETVLELVREHVAIVLGYDSPTLVDDEGAFKDLGFDSLLAVELRNRLSAATGLRLPAAVVFDFPSPLMLSRHLVTQAAGSVSVAPAAVRRARSKDEPIAIVAMSCRLPGGVQSPEALWNVLAGGEDVTSGLPVDRGWNLDALYHPDPDHQGTSYTKRGGFLHDAADFDPDFFGISPREAAAIDPQQRLLLETSWEAFERAGIDPASLRGTPTGVFAGVIYNDYVSRFQRAPEGFEGYLGNGSSASLATGRIAYTFGLEGPAVTLDTACSSSLVALHLAMQALRNGECTLALAGGVTVMATPGLLVEYSRQRGLAPDGRCKPFSAQADGFGASEGAGLVLVERLSDAKRNGHPILAVVRGSSINQDGASNGLTAPNGRAQQRVISEALNDAGLVPGDIDFVEAHGTGTAIGDPIEAEALQVVFAEDREPERPLLLGSIKSNVGHTQAAAGVLGLMKVVLALKNKMVPASLHASEPSQHIDWDVSALKLATEPSAWESNDRPRRAGVSSFGISGTNAHIVVEEAPLANELSSPSVSPPVIPWVVSGKSTDALAEQADRLYTALTESASDVVDVGHSLATTRRRFEHRAVVLGESRSELMAGLELVRSKQSSSNVIVGRAHPRPRLAYIFSGQGSQRIGMGHELALAYPVFASAFEEVCDALDVYLDRPIRPIIWPDEQDDSSLIDQTQYTQPALFAVEIALARLLESWGIVADVVMGHSIGELTAAHLAGLWSLDDASRLIVARGAAMQASRQDGVMISVRAPADEVAALIEDSSGICIAAINGPAATVVSGDAVPVGHLAAKLEAKGRSTKTLRVSHAFHSHHMNNLDHFAAVLDEVTFQPLHTTVVSNLTGQIASDEELGSRDYWLRHIAETVLFHDGVETLKEAGITACLEVGPDGGLAVTASLTLDEAGVAGAMRLGRSEAPTILNAIAKLDVAGCTVDWSTIAPGQQMVALPSYAFQRQRFWLELALGEPEQVSDALWDAIEISDADTAAAVIGLSDSERAAFEQVMPGLSRWRQSAKTRSLIEGWRYTVAWQPILVSTDLDMSGDFLVLSPGSLAIADELMAMLSTMGAKATLAQVDCQSAQLSSMAELIENHSTVVSLLGLAADKHSEFDGVPAGLAANLLLARACASGNDSPRLWCVTSGAVQVEPGVDVDPWQAMTWGLIRAVSLEHPELWGGLVDVGRDVQVESIVSALAGVHGPEDQIALRDNGVFGRRLLPKPSVEHREQWQPKGSVLITGGTGALGTCVARWLADRGASNLVLLSRSGPDANGLDALRDELRDLGTNLSVVAVDVADPVAVAAVVNDLPADAPLTAVFHAAGVGEHRPLVETSTSGLAETMRGKVGGAVALDMLDDGTLERFVVFSSIASTWGSAGQASYAASNAFLDALVQRRHAAGRCATSVAWGPWATAGMAVGDGEEHLLRRGLVPMAQASALAALAEAVDGEDTGVVIADVDWTRFAPTYASARPRPLLSSLAQTTTAESAPQASDDTLAGLQARLHDLDGAGRHLQLVELVRSHAALALGHKDSSSIDPRRAFRELGFDSLAAVELRNALIADTGLALPSTLIYDHPSVDALASCIDSLLLGSSIPSIGVPLTHTAEDPIAIVGMGCRYPGSVESPDDLWDVVFDERDVISELPRNRGWDVEGIYDPDPDRSGTSYVREGGFLHDADRFDAAFFGISPREAIAMDPQQRLLLETAWEAIERATIAPDRLRGTATGVFVGTNFSDYASGLTSAPDGIEGHLLTGKAASVMSGRLAYTLGLEGPAVSVDTACSSSLVALHLACQSLRDGECDLALAGGTAVMSSPAVFVGFSRQRALSPDGRCKAFSDDADGTGWAEGAGVLVLERLSEAKRNGHQVLALVRGSAVNQDGASNGLTAPNGLAQQQVMRRALSNAGLNPEDIDVVEAHGTGTTLGDPIEAQAVIATYGANRKDGPIYLGSLKSNLGHAQAAAGVGGIIKMVQSLRHEMLPKTLHAEQPSKHVDWSTGSVQLLTESVPWPRNAKVRRAGVSSFGMSGTNAHVILEQGDESLVRHDTEPSSGVTIAWPLSANTPAALRNVAQRLKTYLEAKPDDFDPASVAISLARTRALLDERAVITGADRAGLLKALTDFASGHQVQNSILGRANTGVRSPVFVFPGQGSQWIGMGVELGRSSTVFAEQLKACQTALSVFVDWDLLEVLEDQELLSRVDVVQPALWAVMVSLAELWKSHGVEPVAVVGHSQGEIAAACVAGALSLEDGARVVALRSKALVALDGGGMMSVACGVDDIEPILEAAGNELAIAAVNGPRSVVLSGELAAMTSVSKALIDRDVQTRILPVDYAAHSAQVEQIESELAEVLAPIRPRCGDIPFWSATTAGLIDGEDLDACYWYKNLRQTVRFEEAIHGLLAQNYDTYIEISPHAVLRTALEEIFEAQGIDGAASGTLRRDDGSMDRFVSSLSEAHVVGIPVDWSPLTTGCGAVTVDLPTYPFERERFWLDGNSAAGVTSAEHEPDFWAAIERTDVHAMAEMLGLSDDGALSEVLPKLTAWRSGRDRTRQLALWRHGVAWEPITFTGSGLLTGDWLVVVPEIVDQALLQSLLSVLETHGAKPDVLVVEDANRVVLGERLGEMNPAAIVSLLAFDTERRSAPSVPEGVLSTTALLQATIDQGIEAPLWCLTQGAVAVGRSETHIDPEQAMICGIGRVAALEQPTQWGGLVDIPSSLDGRIGGWLVAALAGLDGGEDQLAIRESGLFGRRLCEAQPLDATPAQPWEPTGTVLITGGTGSLGVHAARWLAGRGAEHLLLVSRRGSTAEGIESVVAEIESLGTRVTIKSCDITDRAAMNRLISELPEELPLSAVVHTAGALADTLIADLTPAHFENVVLAKVGGAQILHDLTAHIDLDAFVLYASVAGSWGGAGQANYAAANAYLDALAEQRRRSGLVATSIAWGLWAGTGMASHVADGARLRRGGVEPMDPLIATEVMGATVDASDSNITVANIDWERFIPAYVANRPNPFFANVATAEDSSAAVAAARSEVATALAGVQRADGVQRHRLLVDLVREQVASALGFASADRVDPQRAFKDLGFDSLLAMELRNRLGGLIGKSLPTSIVFDHPTPTALATFIGDTLGLGSAPADSDPVRVKNQDNEPIAIVAMSCRYPGAIVSPEDLWTLLEMEQDVISIMPSDRGWNIEDFIGDSAEDSVFIPQSGGFLSDVAEFDADLFGISPREAMALDPQQRLLLEITWEVFERAGLDPLARRGSQTGVFIGTNGQDYQTLLMLAEDAVEGHIMTGNAASVVSGRLSYTFGLEGPAMTVDTACSASLVALHLACQALQNGECDAALSGGVTVMSTPGAFLEFSRQGGLATDGRCKAFSESADGTGWSEGAGMLLLMREKDARTQGLPVLALVRGSAVNQDGASNGLTAPSGPSQQRVIQAALADAGITADQVDAVEAHGTGTRLGDPIEAHALMATYGRERADNRPLWLGSLKSNLGHTQAAAGVGGVIKMVMAMQNGVLPKTLHVDSPSDNIDWDMGSVELLTQSRQWDESGPRRCGVSSFGVSGTNAHVVLENVVASESESIDVDGASDEPGIACQSQLVPLVLSAATQPGLRAQAARIATYLSETTAPVEDLSATLLSGRASLNHRMVLLSSDHDEALTSLAAVAEGQSLSNVIQGLARPGGRIAMMFSGQGGQRVGMGAQLYHRFEPYADSFDLVLAHFEERLDCSLRDLVFAAPDSPEAELLDQTRYAQAALFAVEVASYKLLTHFGLAPDIVCGHSVGEITAAHVAGILSLPDACALITARGSLMQELPAGGGMLAVAAQVEDIEAAADTAGVDIAAVNGPTSVVLAGDCSTLKRLAKEFADSGHRTNELRVSHAFHSRHMEPMLADFEAAIRGISFNPPTIPILSNLTGVQDGEQMCNTDYWVHHIRQPVLFRDGLESMVSDDIDTFIEVGPGTTLTSLTEIALEGRGLSVPILRNDRDEVESFCSALARLHVNGTAIDWHAWSDSTSVLLPNVPTYPFQRQRFWPTVKPQHGKVEAAGLVSADHPLLAAEVAVPGGDGFISTGRLALATHPWLADHAVHNSVILPGTAYVDLALHAGARLGAAQLEELTLQAPLVVPDDGAVDIQLIIDGMDEHGRRQLRVHSRASTDPNGGWICHAEGQLSEATLDSGQELCEWPPLEAQPIEGTGLYEALAEKGFAYGPVFQGLRCAWRKAGTVFAEVQLPDEVADSASSYSLHPALADAALHTLVLGDLLADTGEGRLPFAWNGVRIHQPGAATVRVCVTNTGHDTVRVDIADGSGAPVATIESLTLRPVSIRQVRAARGAAESLYGLQWVPCAVPSTGFTGPIIDGDSAWEMFLHEVDSGTDAPDFVIARLDAAQADTRIAARCGVEGALRLVQDWLRNEQLERSLLAIVTTGAVETSLSEGVTNLGTSAVWGLVRSAQAEHPGRFLLIDSDTGSSESRLRDAAAVAIVDGETQLAIRSDRVLAPRLTRSTSATEPVVLSTDGSVLVTGGTGAIGQLLCQHLVEEHGVRHLVVASRRGDAAPGADEFVANLDALGAEVKLVACDLGEREDVERLLATIPQARPLTAIFHLAGVVDDMVVTSLSAESIDTVFKPKVDAAIHLHEATIDLVELKTFVLFSSIAGVFGGPGQSGYAAANSFLDALAAHRRMSGLPGQSLAWGLWAEEGAMTTSLSEVDHHRMSRVGLAPMTAKEGLALFDLATGIDSSLVVPVQWNTSSIRASGSGLVPPLLRSLVPVRQDQTSSSIAAANSLIDDLAGLSEEEQSREIERVVTLHVARVLGHADPSTIDRSQAFKDLGFDSLTAVELRNSLNVVTGLRLPATLVFDHPTVTVLSRFIQGQLGTVEVKPGWMAELDRIEQFVTAAEFDSTDRAQIGSRLQSIIASLQSSPAGDDTADRLDEASAEEVFAFIENEFGISDVDQSSL